MIWWEEDTDLVVDERLESSTDLIFMSYNLILRDVYLPNSTVMDHVASCKAILWPQALGEFRDTGDTTHAAWFHLFSNLLRINTSHSTWPQWALSIHTGSWSGLVSFLWSSCSPISIHADF